MAAGYQKFGAATRLVLKGQYAPWKSGEFTLGNDWYRLPNGTNSVNFKSFADLLAAYTPAKAKETASDPMTAHEKLLVSACELFYTQIKSELTANDPGDFASLTQAILDDNNIQNGGELCKKKVASIGIQRVSTITTMRFVMTMQPILTWSMGNTV